VQDLQVLPVHSDKLGPMDQLVQMGRRDRLVLQAQQVKGVRWVLLAH